MRLTSDNIVKIQLLGTPQLLRNDEPVRLYSAKVWALIAYLAFHANQPQSRDWLASLLWGETTEKKARASLRQALYSMKKTVGDLADDLLKVERDSVTFCTIDEVAIDTTDMLYAYTHGDYDEVIDAYKGMLLDGVRLSDCEEYEGWLYIQRNEIEQKVITALHKKIYNLIEVGNISLALSFAQKLTTIDPLNEEGHRILMRLHAMNGNLPIARRQYRLCLTLLEQELGVEPTSETLLLFEQLDEIEQIPIAGTEALSPSVPYTNFPLIQRETELRLIGEVWRKIEKQTDNFIMIRGEAGVGKSRLIEEIIQANQIQRVLIGKCFEIEMNTPYSVWSDLLKSLTTTGWRAQINDLEPIWMKQIARIVPSIGLISPTNDEGVSQDEKRLRLLQGVIRCLIHLASNPLLLIFEDIHWADKTSIELLHYAIRQVTNYPILLIATMRDDGIMPHILQLERSLQGSQYLINLELLNTTSVTQLVDSVELPISSELRTTLVEFCGGNPYVLTETIQVLSELESQGEQLKSNSLSNIADGVRQLVLERLNNIGEEHKRVVETLAISNRPLNIYLLPKITGIDELRLLEYLDFLLVSGFLVDRNRDSRIEISHEYIRQTIVGSMRTIRKFALHRRIAEAMINLPKQQAKDIAYHFSQADDERAISYLILAAEQALALYALHEASQIYEQALAFIQTHTPQDYQQQIMLCLELEHIHDQLGRRSTQANLIQQLEELAVRTNDLELRTHIHIRKAGLMTYTSQFEQAHQALIVAIAYYRENNDTVSEAHTLREMGFLQWNNGQYSLALENNQSALQLYRKSGYSEGEATALHNLGEIHRTLNSPHQAINFYHQSQEIFWGIGIEEGLVLASYGLGQTYLSLREFDDAIQAFQKAEYHSKETNNQRMLSRAYHSLGIVNWEQEQGDEALNYLDKAIHIGGEMGFSHDISHSLWLKSLYHSQLGHQQQAKECIEKVIEWLEFVEDKDLLQQAKQWLSALNSEVSGTLEVPSTLMQVQAHVNIAQGKVYCMFESPAAMHQLASNST